MSNVIVFDHPLIQHKLTVLRKTETGSKEFRELITEISMLMCYEVTRDIELEDEEIVTAMGVKMIAKKISGKKLGIIPILRAGLGMVDGFLNLIPTARVGHIGLYRDPETLEPVEYYNKLPSDVSERTLYLLDPMLATGGSLIASIDILKREGCKNIKCVHIIAAPEGIEVVQKAHPDVDIYVAAVDERLDENAYIIPGLGDAGDRLFGTK
ncbi:MAG: uracil phosphoribosyltransferase [Tissierellia bacterium]|nr:uracil phosphoribosyltransferase [Tissierellia bacterium]